jgi:ubiquinone/menaquinone biosynthesis C-methylase UbiE
MTREEIERSLEEQIEPWLMHMRWRADFAEWRKKRLWQENYQAEALAELRRYGDGVNSRSRVLDLGAGMGGFAVAFLLSQVERAAREPSASAHSKLRPALAVDYNFAYCEIARTRARRYNLDLPALVAAGEYLPFADDSFGILTCWDVVEHVQDPVQLFTEIARVLKPDGRAFVTVINRLALVDPHYHLRFVNWLPRSLGERYVSWRHRTKASPLRDRQRLGEMHYFTFGTAVKLAARFGLCVQDLNASRSRFNRFPRPIAAALYRLWRTFGMGTYRLVMTKL